MDTTCLNYSSSLLRVWGVYVSVFTLHHVEAEPDYLAHELSLMLLALSPLSYGILGLQMLAASYLGLGTQTRLRTLQCITCVLFTRQTVYLPNHLASTKMLFLNKVTFGVCSLTCIWEGESAVGEATKVTATGEMISPRSQSEKVTRIGIGTQVLCLSCALIC